MLVILGWIFFIIGIIGIFVPGLPTTPFLILTAYCFSKGSKRLHTWLIKTAKNWDFHKRLGRTSYH